MKITKRSHVLKVVVVIIILAGILAVTSLKIGDDTESWITATVERGDVQNVVSVSGFVEAKNTANLSFPVTGIVTDVFVKEGEEVKKGNLLATLGSAKLVAQRADAVGILQKARAARTELLDGPTTEARAVTDTTVSSAEANLTSVGATEAEKVANAKATLLSNGLEARALDNEETATAPTITGSYTCTTEGIYTLSVYSSGSLSGFSYNLSGLESETANVTFDQPSNLGSCGLSIQFTDGDSYASSQWAVRVPNTLSSTYVTYKNAYDLALAQQKQNVKTAQDALTLAQGNKVLANAAPSTAAVQQVDASIYSAQARIEQINAQIADLSIMAPFDGMITDVDVRPGETAGASPVMTLLASDAFELKARIPEIDITKVIQGQHTKIVFDAKSNETLKGTITFVSPLATEIDGVAYFETTIEIEETPLWIRSGLNADIDIVVSELQDILRIPKRFLIQNDDGSYDVLVPDSKVTDSKSIKVVSLSNSGYAVIDGLNEGDTVIAP
ncbi:MAG: HlyD family secretion protein [Acidimicrobiales bacterium]|jgi:HlyD family secretion protein